MIRITCTNCQKPLSLDETKLPMREVTFPCPVCKAKLAVDRRQFATAAAPDAPTTQPAHAAEGGSEEDDHENELGAKALIVGQDSAALRQAAKLVGFLPVVHAEAAKAREFFNQELPQIVFLHPAQMTAPPLDAIGPMVSVIPSERRRSFFVLVADNLRTLDGNAAFLYGVNLVVATKDLPQFPQIYRDALAAHERLYASMKSVLREKELV
jgi:hypothetical protein